MFIRAVDLALLAGCALGAVGWSALSPARCAAPAPALARFQHAATLAAGPQSPAGSATLAR